jgi:hypothetical protein
MRKVFRKRVRHSEGGVNIAADIDAAVAVNTGKDGSTSHTVVRSTHHVAQGATGHRDRPDPAPDPPSGPSETERDD